MSSIGDIFGFDNFGGFGGQGNSSASSRPHIEGEFNADYYATLFEMLTDEMKKARVALVEQESDPFAAMLRQIMGGGLRGEGNPGEQSEKGKGSGDFKAMLLKQQDGELVPTTPEEIEGVPPEVQELLNRLMNALNDEEEEEEEEGEEEESNSLP